MLVVETDVRIICGAAVGRTSEVTVLALHPSLTQHQRDQFAQELLTEGELIQWEEQRNSELSCM